MIEMIHIHARILFHRARSLAGVQLKEGMWNPRSLNRLAYIVPWMYKSAHQYSILTFSMVVPSRDVDLKVQRVVSIMTTRPIPSVNGNVSHEAHASGIIPNL